MFECSCTETRKDRWYPLLLLAYSFKWRSSLSEPGALTFFDRLEPSKFRVLAVAITFEAGVTGTCRTLSGSWDLNSGSTLNPKSSPQPLDLSLLIL